MKKDIYKLVADNKPLPKGTKIKTTIGGAKTGGTHELSEDQLRSANQIVNGRFPLWIHAWANLHDDLRLP